MKNQNITITTPLDISQDWEIAIGKKRVEDLFGSSTPTILEIISQFPCLAKFSNLLLSIANHKGQFCALTTVRHAKVLKRVGGKGEVAKTTVHKNLRSGINYNNQKLVNELHEKGEVEKQGFITGRTVLTPWLYIRLDALAKGEFSELDFTLGFTPNWNIETEQNRYFASSIYSYEDKEISRDKAIELAGSVYSKKSEKPFTRFTPFVAKVLNFAPMS